MQTVISTVCNSETEVTQMTTVSLQRNPGDAKLSTADEQPRHERLWRRAFVLSAIVGWSALITFGVLAMAGEMFAAVTLLTISASAFAAHWTGSHLPSRPHSRNIRS